MLQTRMSPVFAYTNVPRMMFPRNTSIVTETVRVENAKSSKDVTAFGMTRSNYRKADSSLLALLGITCSRFAWPILT